MLDNIDLVYVIVIEPDEKLNKKILLKLRQQGLKVKGFLEIHRAYDFLMGLDLGLLILINYSIFEENIITLSELSNSYGNKINFILMEDNAVGRRAEMKSCVNNCSVVVRNKHFINTLPYYVDKSLGHFNIDQKVVRLQEDLKKSMEMYRLVIDGSSDGIFDWDIVNNSIFYSKQYKRTLGFSEEDNFTTLEDWSRLIHPEDKKDVLKILKDYLEGRMDDYSVEYRMKNKNGDYRWMATKAQAIWDSNGRPLRMAGSHRDITEHKNYERKLYRLAYFDQITGLYNRSFFIKKINEVIAEGHGKRQFAVLFIDLDKFKEVNDTLGHDAGDLLLRDIAKMLKDCVNEDDIVARLGGDEFTILRRIKHSPVEIMELCNRMRERFTNPWVVENHEFYLTLSIGIAIYPRDGINCCTLLKNADIAMYRAKDRGRNKYVFYNSIINNEVVVRIETNSGLIRALRNNEFVLYYQPLISASTKRTIGAEALIRWNHPLKGLIMPGQFIQEAEDSGFIVSICEWVIKTALSQLREWQSKGYDELVLSVNISALCFQQPDFVDNLIKYIREAGVSGSSLELEITESTALRDIPYTRLVLNKLKELNIRVFLDDFGTGYSSLNYLSKLPIHGFKLDRALIEEIPESHTQTAIVKSLITLAHELDLKVTAEGVETREQLNFLEAHNFHRIQGYFYSKPLAEKDFEAWLVGEKNN